MRYIYAYEVSNLSKNSKEIIDTPASSCFSLACAAARAASSAEGLETNGLLLGWIMVNGSTS